MVSAVQLKFQTEGCGQPANKGPPRSQLLGLRRILMCMAPRNSEWTLQSLVGFIEILVDCPSDSL